MEEKRCLIIHNPLSGKGINENILNEYQKILNDKGYIVDIVTTKYKHHATEEIYSADNYDIVFSIGGDGTLNEVIRGNYLRSDKLTICPLPSGTCNDVATMLGYGKNVIDNLNMALDGEIHDVDFGTINNDPFIYVVGMGKFMNIPYETKSIEKRKHGYIAYLKGASNEIFNKIKRYKAEINIDGIKMDGKYSLIMVSNSNHIAGIDNFHKNVCLNDDKMEVLLCKSKNKKDFIVNFVKYFMEGSSENIISLKAHEINIKLLDLPDKNWCIDGEKYNYDGYEYNIKVGGKMKILTPKIKTKTLFK